ncbi:MAG: cob(I)yrinic acid a,c-diamide adenosyltransferase [Synergistes sp.]|nr:cob(I)yrinic acid a,c-diamide adenosyltransferase [Synergistes sp.]
MFGEKGLVQLYTGDGKGKTTAALGLLLRAAGHGARTAVVQFMKGSDIYGEIKMLEQMTNVTLVRTGRTKCIFKGEETQEDFDEALRGIEAARRFISSGEFDLVILDEVNVATDFGLINPEDVINIIKGKARNTEVVLTGRNAPQDFIEAADLISEMKEIKHPWRSGVTARKGVEY